MAIEYALSAKESTGGIGNSRSGARCVFRGREVSEPGGGRSRTAVPYPSTVRPRVDRLTPMSAVFSWGNLPIRNKELRTDMIPREPRIPVILDTDIGGDIDDTWALALMLKSPELDIKLVAADTGDTTYRARIIAKLLETAGRTDIPVAIGTPYATYRQYRQEAWIAGYSIDEYPGTVRRDGVNAIIETIMESPEPITLVCIGPVPNIGEALEREPRIAENARFVGMHGSIYRGYGGSADIAPECNVVNHTSACQKVFTAPWEITITPVDTCGIVVLRDEKYQAVRHCPDPVVRAVMENYRAWLEKNNNLEQFDVRSSTLFDTVAVYLAFSEELLRIEEIGVRVTDDGYTLVDENAKRVRAAVDWTDLGAFEDFLAARLTGVA